MQDTLVGLRAVLEGVEKSITQDTAKISWHWDDEAVFQAAASPNGIPASVIQEVIDNVLLGFRRVSETKENTPIAWPPSFNEEAQRALIHIVRQLPKLEAIRVEGEGSEPFDILEAHLHEKLESRRIGYTEYSSIDGVLDLVSTRKRPHFSLKEHGTGRYVQCTFADELFDEVKKALGKRIVIEGKVKFRPDGTPMSAHAIHIFIRPPSTRSLDKLIGSLPNFTEGVSAGEYVRQLRGDEEG